MRPAPAAHARSSARFDGAVWQVVFGAQLSAQTFKLCKAAAGRLSEISPISIMADDHHPDATTAEHLASSIGLAVLSICPIDLRSQGWRSSVAERRLSPARMVDLGAPRALSVATAADCHPE